VTLVLDVRKRVVGVIAPKNARRVRTSLSAASALRTPPTEMQLWSVGANPTDYGVHVWNERSVASVLELYTTRGNPLLIDVEHNGSQLADGEPAVTGGYARLEVRGGAPWLVFEWSDYGRAQIASGQRRFLSPEYDVDKDTGEILALYRVSLVADPGTHRARMLATSRQDRRMEMTTLLAALRAALAAEDPAVCKESIANLVAELDKGAGGESDAEGEPPATAGAGEDKPAGMQTGADDGAQKDEDDKSKQMAGAKPATAPTTPARPAPEKSDKVTAAADDAVRLIQNSTRDHLLATHGDKLDPSIRRWASSQPLEVVKGLLDAAPAKDAPLKRGAPTRGNAGPSGLTERELQKCKAKGVDPAKYAALKAASVGGS